MGEPLQNLLDTAADIGESGAVSAYTTVSVSSPLPRRRERRSGKGMCERLARKEDRREGHRRLVTNAKTEKLANRLWSCGFVAHGQSKVQLVCDQTGRGYFKGLKQCGSVWCCPDCSERICTGRKKELDALLQFWRRLNVATYLITLTFRHVSQDRLAMLLDKLKGAYRSFMQSRQWRTYLKPFVDGYVTTTEVTIGRNGFHPHFHMIVGLKGCTADEGYLKLEELRDTWQVACAAHGLDASEIPAFDLVRANNVGQYVSKFGAAGELTLQHAKVGRKGSMTPWQLLRWAWNAPDEAERRRCQSLWQEYATVFQGRKQLVWSKGLKARVNIDDVTDDELADVEGERQPLENPRVLREWDAGTPAWAEAKLRSAQLLRAVDTGGDLDAAEFGPTDGEVIRRRRRQPEEGADDG